MFARRIQLFTLSGFKVSLDLSWFLLAALLVWSLASGYFPTAAPDFHANTYFWMGVAGAIGLFASIVFHEFAHAMVARRFDLPISGITLFIFGGVAEMAEEPATPAAEFWMAIAGPIASVLAAAAFYLVSLALPAATPLTAVVAYLAFINIVLAAFNMLPAFPLDGGRVLRATLWWLNGDHRKSTRIAAAFGVLLGGALMVLGVLNIVTGNFIGGIWQLLIGFFIQSAAGASRSQTDMREALKDIRVQHVMRRDVVSAPADITVTALVDDYFYRYNHKFFPVIDARGRPLGCVRLAHVRAVPRDQWSVRKVADIMEPLGPGNTLRATDTAIDTLQRMRRDGPSRFMVVESGELRAVVTLRDLLDALAVRMELEENTAAGPVSRPRESGAER